MRASLAALALLFAPLLSSCGGLDTIVLSEERMVSLPKPVKNPAVGVGIVPLAFEHTVAMPNDKVNADSIDSVRLKRLEVVLPDPSEARNFDFIRELRVYVQTPTAPSRLVATKGPMTPGASVATLDIQNIELKEFLATKDAQIRLQFLGTQPNEQLNVRVEVDLLIDINLSEVLF